MWKYIIAIGIVVLLVAIYIISYVLNQKTEIPEECRNLEDFSACSTCTNQSCTILKKGIPELNDRK
ncbi:MAG TPA: hypothetical protein PLH02_01965 [Bacillota bacterium]|nr:hypothetical protein [Bacillota bacterium]HPF42249.1 hypothetical protein [Bacillota bacterium]HPJ85729.1 hypothetical protein [Bacillota bacterium]HPQ61634.1 hypothetical protein [Bacillota bacterium]HRX91541.1 hypothetical protein [Candidatus Izemoplasmatales bacterium]